MCIHNSQTQNSWKKRHPHSLRQKHSHTYSNHIDRFNRCCCYCWFPNLYNFSLDGGCCCCFFIICLDFYSSAFGDFSYILCILKSWCVRMSVLFKTDVFVGCWCFSCFFLCILFHTHSILTQCSQYTFHHIHTNLFQLNVNKEKNVFVAHEFFVG